MKNKTLLVLAASVMPLTSCVFGGFTEVGDDKLEFDMTATRANIDKLANSTGFEITVKFTSDATNEDKEETIQTVGAKDGVYWTVTKDEDPYGEAYVVDSAKDLLHEYDFGTNGWTYYTTNKLSEDGFSASAYLLSITPFFYMGHIHDGALKKTGTTKVAGRDCVSYKYSVNILIERFEYDIAIDKETGATLKYSLSAGVMGESAEETFEVTSFKTSGINAPTLPEPDEYDEGGYDDPIGGDDPIQGGETDSRYAKELEVDSKRDLVSTRNVKLVAKYKGTQDNLTNDDDIFIEDYGTLDIYWVWTGFNSNGDADFINGYTCLYYFFDTKAEYDAGLSLVKSYNLRAKNPDKLYFTVRTTAVDGETYDEMRQSLIDGDFRLPNFEIVE